MDQNRVEQAALKGADATHFNKIMHAYKCVYAVKGMTFSDEV